MKKVYLVYDVFYDNEECSIREYLQEIHSSMSAAKTACSRLANDLLDNYTNDGITARRGIDDEGNITIYRYDNCEDHFIIEVWDVQ